MQRIVGVLEMSKKRPAEVAPVASEQAEKRKQVNIDAELLRKAKAIAGIHDMTVPDYINNRLKVIIDEEFDSVVKGYGYTKAGGSGA